MAVNKPSTKKIFCFLFTGVFCLFFLSASAQGGDTNKTEKNQYHSSRPAKAMLYSAILPGMGQAYNKSYWKIPIIYAGIGVAAYFIAFNQHYYNVYRDSLSGQRFTVYSSSQLSDLVTYYNRNKWLSIIIVAGVYMLNIVDANVDAQLHGFNVSDDISLHFSPNLVPNMATGSISFQPGITLVKRL